MRKCQETSKLFDELLAGATMAQNRCKTEHVATFFGDGREAQTRDCVKRVQEAGLGKVLSKARYLGSWSAFDGCPNKSVDVRIDKAKETFYALKGFWRSGAPLRDIRDVYKGEVWNTLLSGMEVEPMRKCDYERMEVCLCLLIRKALGKLPWMKMDKGGTHAKRRSNVEIRHMIRVSSVYLELRIRRLNQVT